MLGCTGSLSTRSIWLHCTDGHSNGAAGFFRSPADALFIPLSDRGALDRHYRMCGVELPVALFDAASQLAPGNNDADMVRASPPADSEGSRPRIRDDVAHHSDWISLGVPGSPAIPG